MITKRPPIILVVDDDADDRLMIREAFKEIGHKHELFSVENGEELMDYLYHRGVYVDAALSPAPELILLDLNMPKKDGRESLKELKESPEFKNIPVVVFTTSKTEEDVYITYYLGVNSFIIKPVTFEALVSIVRDLGRYWFEVVELPKKPLKNFLNHR